MYEIRKNIKQGTFENFTISTLIFCKFLPLQIKKNQYKNFVLTLSSVGEQFPEGMGDLVHQGSPYFMKLVGIPI